MTLERRQSVLLVLALLAPLSCVPDDDDSAPQVEGDEPGECDDTLDDDGDGLVDCDDPGCQDDAACPSDAPPSAPVVDVEPAAPRTDDALTCSITVEGVDPEGQPVEHALAWTVDGQDAGIGGAVIEPSLTVRGQLWTCAATARDPGGMEGPPGRDSVTIWNSPPGAPEVAIQPHEPLVTDPLRCRVLVEAPDADGDPVQYERSWSGDGEPVAWEGEVLPAQQTRIGDQWTCLVTPRDPWEPGPAASDAVSVHVDVQAHVAAGRDHACAMRQSGTFSCWGDGSLGQSSEPAESLWMLEAGADFNCGIRYSDGALVCWGDGGSGQDQPPGDAAVDLALGTGHACAALASGGLAAWGSSAGWPDPPPDIVAVGVAAGDGWCCALDLAGAISCWGEAPPMPSGGPWEAVDGGGGLLCALHVDGTLACWGDDSSGQVSLVPTGSFSAVSAGPSSACALAADGGEALCWGDDSSAQSSPPGDAFTSISVGWHHACGTRPDGTVACWGCLGHDSGQCSPDP